MSTAKRTSSPVWTLAQGLLEWANETPDRLYMVQPRAGRCTEYTWADAADQAGRMAAHLQQRDLPAGSRVAILSKNCAHFVLADAAICMAGHVSVPIYPSLRADSMGYILDHSETAVMFLGEVDDWAGLREGLPTTLPVIAFPEVPTESRPDHAVDWNDALASTAMRVPAEVQPDALCRLVYTSGSTGKPKGVMLPYRAIAAASDVLLRGVKPDIGPGDRMISYLPLAHVFEAAAVEASSLRHGFTVYFSEGLPTFPKDLQRARPTLFISVPRLWVKFQQAVLSKLPQAQLDRLLADPAQAGAVRQQVLTQLGLHETRVAITGSAPLAPSVQAWYRDLGLELLEGYGMSEDFAMSHLSRPGRSRIGYVGHAVPGVQRRLADSGEVQIKSPGGMLGYYKQPDKTAEAYTEDGWFRTGDLGEIDEDGRLRITGRLKELFKTAKGKYVAPVPIECRLGIPNIEAVCVTGAGRPQPCVLMMLSPASADLLTTADARTAFSEVVQTRLDAVNAASEHHEQLAFAVVISEPWSIENGLLTPTMKIKRNAIEARYADKLDTWYAAGQAVVWA